MQPLVCKSCNLALTPMGEDEEVDFLIGEKSDFWPNSYICSCGNRMLLTDSPIGDNRFLSPEEVFHFLSGLGLPEENLCTEDVVKGALAQGVKSVQGKYSPGDRTYVLESLEMQDGKKVFLGASSRGAVVYRISPPSSNAKKVLNG